MNMTKRQLAGKKRAFKQLFISHLTARIRKVENRQISNIRSIDTAVGEITGTAESMNNSAERIRTIITMGNKLDKALGREFDNMMQMPQVRGLKFSSDKRRLFVFLEITSRLNNQQYCWKMNIPANGDYSGMYHDKYGILFTGYTGSCAQYNNNRWCLGTIADDAEKYVEGYEFDALVALLIELLEDNTGQTGDVIRTESTWKTQLGKLGPTQKQKETYVKICSKRKYWLVPFHKGTITKESEKLKEPLESLRKARTNDCTLEIDALKRLKNSKLRALSQEFDRIAAMPDLESISFGRRTLYLETNPLNISHENGSKPIGTFQISINTDCLITILPINTGDGGIAHPSLSAENGVILMKPAIRVSLAKLLAGHRFSDAVSIMLDLLKTYDPQLVLEPLEIVDKPGKEG